MTRKQSPMLIIIALITLITAFGCGSSDSNPAAPSTNNQATPQIEANANPENGNTGVLGVYDLIFDPETVEIELVQSRGADAHYDVSAFMSSYCSASLTSWDPVSGIMIFDLTLWNPTLTTVYDLRTLMLAPPSSGIVQLNPDDYTYLFSPFGPGFVNPFRAYGKSVADRAFLPGAVLTEEFQVQFPIPLVLPTPAKLLVECSYPTNCEDPYMIHNQVASNPVNSTTSATITLDVFDHQDNVVSVAVDTTPITGGHTWLTSISPDTWQGTVINSAGAAPGTYFCLISALSDIEPMKLYDYVEIIVIPDAGPLPGWTSVDYPIPDACCELDLGVIADPGGARDSNILMVKDYSTNCDSVYKYDANYTSWNYYVDTVTTLDSNYADYAAYPIKRIDAADDGAFSFTNENWTDWFKTYAGTNVYFAQVWNVLDNNPSLHTGPYPDDSRYYNDLMYDAYIRPADVCDDFELGQYALFTSDVDYTPEDLGFLGVMPNTYTYDRVLFNADMDAYAGLGDGEVNPSGILGIDVIEGMGELDDAGMVDAANLYVLEQSGYLYQVEVYQVLDTASGLAFDFIHHVMTINIDEYVNMDYWVEGRDLEILPINPYYMLNATDPTVCVLVSYLDYFGKLQGEIFLYNASTGAFLEAIGSSPATSALPEHDVQYLDTDDGDWEIHVTSRDATGAPIATIFSY